MQVDFSKQFKNFDGTTIPEKAGEDKSFTLATASINAVMNPEEKLSGEDSVKRLDLATAIYAATKPLELTSEQVSLIKAQIAKVYGPLIVGQAWKMLEGQL